MWCSSTSVTVSVTQCGTKKYLKTGCFWPKMSLFDLLLLVISKLKPVLSLFMFYLVTVCYNLKYKSQVPTWDHFKSCMTRGHSAIENVIFLLKKNGVDFPRYIRKIKNKNNRDEWIVCASISGLRRQNFIFAKICETRAPPWSKRFLLSSSTRWLRGNLLRRRIR